MIQPTHKANKWLVLIVDDEKLVHDSLKMNLRDVVYADGPVFFLHAYLILK